MNHFILKPIVSEEDKNLFTKEIQEVFQYSYEREFGKCEKTILPAKDIEESFASNGAEAYFALVDGEVVGGVVIEVDHEIKKGHLELLYVKIGCQGNDTGQSIWKGIEELHPETEVWETVTPYFEKRNIHFYVNKLGFHIVEFYHRYHQYPLPNGEPAGGMSEENGYDFFRFEKNMK